MWEQLPPTSMSIHPSQANFSPVPPKLPCLDLVDGPREEYIKTGIPLYEASIKCDWKAAKAILDKKPELVRYSITRNGETSLHVAASSKRSKKAEDFVKDLVDLMNEDDLMIQNHNHNTALYLAVAAGNIKTVKIMVEKNKALWKIPGAGGTMMPLYAAALFGHYETVKYLYETSNELSDDGWNNMNRGLLLERCVEADMFDVALEIVRKYSELNLGNVLGVLSRKPEAFRETKSNIIKSTIKLVFVFFRLNKGALEKENQALPLLKIIWETVLKRPNRNIDDLLRGPADSIGKKDKSASGRVLQALQLHTIISANLDSLNGNMRHPDYVFSHLDHWLTDYLLDLSEQIQKIVKRNEKKVFGNGDQGLPYLISEQLKRLHVDKHTIIESHYSEHEKLTELKNVVYKHIKEMRDVIRIKETHSSRVLFIAAEMGNTNFLVELIRQYPDLMWKVDENNHTIFHIAIKYRHERIYNLLYEIGSVKDMITPIKDDNGNNMLHLAAKSTKKKQLEDVSGAALQMQRELLWFQEVRNIIPPSYRERLNEDGLTPRELFTEEHKDLIIQGEKWMKETASQCMVVAALIATIVFAAAFTIPGGYNQNDGIPIFYRKLTFVIFVVADAISLFSSSASILTFLSILTSRYAERDFVRALPTKLMLGLSTLFLSIATMMITFSVSFFVLYNREMKWIPILIGVLAVTPVLLYVVLQYNLLVDVIRSTYGSKYLFKPAKQLLYYENPRI